MASKRISQREARRLDKRVAELEAILDNQRKSWCQDWFGATEIARVTWPKASDEVPTAVRISRRLGHAVVAVGDDGGMVRFLALPHAKGGA